MCPHTVHTAPVSVISHRHSLPKDARQFFDSDTGVLEVPVTVQVAGQVCMMLYFLHSLFKTK